ncbi:hypothetical protein ACN469_13995 [Corallococcus terminator]
MAVTSLGALTSVGSDVVTSCAAQRAGLSNPRPLDALMLAEAGDEPEGVIGHPIHPLTQGFFLLGLWVRIATVCVRDLIRYGKLPPGRQADFWERTGIIACAPWLGSGRLPLSQEKGEELLVENYLRPVFELLELPVTPENLWVEESGHCAVAQAIAQAGTLLSEGRVDRVLVLGVDSYADRFSLEWLMETNALKTRSHPVGAMPGEAGACFLLESKRSVQARAAQVEALVGIPAVSLASDPERRDASDVGRRLAEVLHAVSQATGGAQLGDLFLDLNGEEWRARAWGTALVCLSQPSKLGLVREIVPCTSFGETGAASAALGLCLAVRSRVRRYARGARSLICSMNERGDVSAFAVLSGAPSSVR